MDDADLVPICLHLINHTEGGCHASCFVLLLAVRSKKDTSLKVPQHYECICKALCAALNKPGRGGTHSCASHSKQTMSSGKNLRCCSGYRCSVHQKRCSTHQTRDLTDANFLGSANIVLLTPRAVRCPGKFHGRCVAGPCLHRCCAHTSSSSSSCHSRSTSVNAHISSYILRVSIVRSRFTCMQPRDARGARSKFCMKPHAAR